MWIDNRAEVGSDGVYPARLMGPNGFIEGPLDLKVQCIGISAQFLDVNVTLHGQFISYKHYDKRDDIPAFLNARPFPDIDATLSESCKYAVYSRTPLL